MRSQTIFCTDEVDEGYFVVAEDPLAFSRRNSFFLYDGQTEQGASFHKNRVLADLERHHIHVSPLFKPLLEWLCLQDLSDIKELPISVNLTRNTKDKKAEKVSPRSKGEPEEHVHKYKRAKLGKDYLVYKCMLPNCPHYLPRKLVVGRQSLCWICAGQFIMSTESSSMTRPHCPQCTRRRPRRESVAANL